MILYLSVIVDIDDCPSPDPCTDGSCQDGINDFTCSCDTGYENPTPSGCSGRYTSRDADKTYKNVHTEVVSSARTATQSGQKLPYA